MMCCLFIIQKYVLEAAKHHCWKSQQIFHQWHIWVNSFIAVHDAMFDSKSRDGEWTQQLLQQNMLCLQYLASVLLIFNMIGSHLCCDVLVPPFDDKSEG